MSALGAPAGNAPASFETVRAAVSSGTNTANAARLLAKRGLDERREREALAAIAVLPSATRRDPVLQHLVGLLHRARSELAPAIVALDRALASLPGDPRLVHARARFAAEAGLPALDWFARARALAPVDGDVILGEAAALVSAGRVEAADALLAGMLAAHPGWIAGHETLLQIRYAWCRSDWLALLDTAIATAPGDGRLHQIKVRVLMRAGEQDRAAAALAEAVRACGAEAMASLSVFVASESGLIGEADRLFAGVARGMTSDGSIGWLRHLLRRGEPERIVSLESGLQGPSRTQAWPYVSLAWRMTGDPRSAWLDDPRLVQVIDIGADWAGFDALADVLRALHLSPGQPLDQSVRGGTQTDGPLLARIDPAISALRGRLRNAVAGYVAALPADDANHPLLGRKPREPNFAGSWSVRLTDGGFHEAHVHSQGWLSSAFYVALPRSDDDMQQGDLALGRPQPSLGLTLPPTRQITPKAGRLILFPSTLWHETLPFSQGERLTVAFDIA